MVIPNDEFVTLQRAAGVLGRAGAQIQLCSWEDLAKACMDSVLDDDEEKKESPIHNKRIVLFLLVNSCTQRVQSLEWVHQVSRDTLVAIDITQAVCNIERRAGGAAQCFLGRESYQTCSLWRGARIHVLCHVRLYHQVAFEWMDCLSEGFA